MSNLLTVKEAAYELDCSERTLRRWIDEGKIRACEVGPTRRTRLTQDTVEQARAPKEK
jgi:excisionase family DNA binding protein